MTPRELLPISDIHEPDSALDLAGVVSSCHAENSAVYAIGGATSLDYGLPAKKRGIGLSLSKLNRVIDYPARDMTITVEAGITMRGLSELLAEQRQRLPVDVPRSDLATLGGVVATNFNGPRRFGQGTIRDYVIGISAVDGRGSTFKGGGRVVKNVAGYDFCKLLTGSLGTLGVITQITLKLKPIPERLAVMVCGLSDLDEVEKILSSLVQSKTMPAAVELFYGTGWGADLGLEGQESAARRCPFHLAVLMEGNDSEVRWMSDQLGRELWEQGVTQHQVLLDSDASRLMQRIAEFPTDQAGPLVLKASMVPSGVTKFIEAATKLDAACSLLAHAADGVILLRMAQVPKGGVTKGLIGTLQSAAVAGHGSMVVLSGAAADATHPSVWGTNLPGLSLMNAVKREFDPKNILNPDRFIYYS